MSRSAGVRFDPANVLAPAEAPASEANASEVQTVAGATPEEDEAPWCSHFANVQFHDLKRIVSVELFRKIRKCLVTWSHDKKSRLVTPNER